MDILGDRQARHEREFLEHRRNSRRAAGAWIGKHDHLLIETDEGRRISLRDPRRFGSVDLVPTAELEAWPAFAVYTRMNPSGPSSASPSAFISRLMNSMRIRTPASFAPFGAAKLRSPAAAYPARRANWAVLGNGMGG